MALHLEVPIIYRWQCSYALFKCEHYHSYLHITASDTVTVTVASSYVQPMLITAVAHFAGVIKWRWHDAASTRRFQSHGYTLPPSSLSLYVCTFVLYIYICIYIYIYMIYMCGEHDVVKMMRESRDADEVGSQHLLLLIR